MLENGLKIKNKSKALLTRAFFIQKNCPKAVFQINPKKTKTYPFQAQHIAQDIVYWHRLLL
jgi:hypothetical protein